MLSPADNDIMIADDIKVKVASHLKAYRLERDLTLEQIGLAVKVSASTIHKIECGTHYPSDRTFYRMRKHLPGFMADIDGEQYAGTDSAN